MPVKIAICIKQTPDTEARIRIAADGQSIEEEGVSWIISPHDEAAVEQALQLKEAHGGHVTVVALGPRRVERSIREALAMGSDAGLHLVCEPMPADASVIAGALTKALRPRGFDLILTGEQAIDLAGSQVPQRLSIALGWPCVVAAETLSIKGRMVQARRPAEQKEALVRFALPGVVGVNRRIGEPRYPSFKGIMRAKRKAVEVDVAQLAEGRMIIERLHYPPAKAEGQVQSFGSGIEDTVARLLAGHIDTQV